ncbi:MAG: bifunctional DNA-formamidopyrimidine glycosylase/DNA-(apurinic or apyrimidinic site) lyase [Alphaproteobacteria bacterium]|nr:bifunctional DNA-formamidopyrimidine glycosylase/DNA-(apurinic or apyrimidinic site) lyase [Alphaproteobacteria bacterium]
MPELPEVETVRLSLAQHLCGKTIQRVTLFRADLRFEFPQDFTAKLTGCTITAVERWAKYLLLRLDDEAYWLIHLGMSGQCRLGTPEDIAQKHDHVEVDFSEQVRLHYRDPRRFGVMDWLKTPDQHKAFVHLGREAILTPGTYPVAAARGVADAAYFSDILATRRSSIKQALFNQRIIAGLGNIYINEALWMVGIDPRTPCCAVPTQLFSALAESINEVLTQALNSGGSSLRDFVNTDGSLGYFQHAWQVYGRAGQPCRKSGCNGSIAQCRQNGRLSLYCPEHQTLFCE